MPTFTSSIQCNTAAAAKWLEAPKKAVKRNRSIWIGKEEVKLTLFAVDIILYLKNYKKYIKNN